MSSSTLTYSQYSADDTPVIGVFKKVVAELEKYDKQSENLYEGNPGVPKVHGRIAEKFCESMIISKY